MKVAIKKIQRRSIEIDPEDREKLLELAKKYKKKISPDDLEIYMEDSK